MPIIHKGIQREPTTLWRDLSPTAYRDVPVAPPQVPPDWARYQFAGTNLCPDLSLTRASIYPIPDTSAHISRVIDEWLASAEPARDLLEWIRTEFESYMKARGARAREEIFQRLTLADPSKLLAVGREQYAAHGNGDRLVLTADLLASAGRRAYEALKHLTSSYCPELIYFVHGIATSPELTGAEKTALMLQIAQNAEGDAELLECLESGLEWFPADVRHKIQKAVSSSGTLGRAA
jgi:hypothetical protein